MFINNFDPVAFEFLTFEIRWYSLSYIAGIVLAWIYIKKFILKETEYSKYIDDLISYIIIGVIIGGRLGYVIFYNFKYYISNPLEIVFKMKLTSKEETDILSKRIEKLEKKIENLEKRKKTKSKLVKRS